MIPWQSIVLFPILFGWAASQCNYAVCRTYCNSSRACFGHACPDVMTIGQHVTVFFNWSTARIDWTMGVEPAETAINTVLDLENYRRLLNNQSYVFDYQSIPRVFNCQINKGGPSQGRGWAVVYTCTSPVCHLWHEELAQNEMDPCAENCTTGTVGDGECNPACNVSACAFDLGDCDPKPTLYSSTTNPDQGVVSSSTTQRCAPGCDSSSIGNGICDAPCAVPWCSNDGGDCVNTNPCASNPCQNGGACSAAAGSSIYSCACVSNYCGPQCQYTFWTQDSPAPPTNSFCLAQYNSCQDSYQSFRMCCYGSVSDCTQTSNTLPSASRTPSPSPPLSSSLPNSAANLLNLF